MRNLVLAFSFLSSVNLFANCELIYSGFHTVGVYENKEYKKMASNLIDFEILNNQLHIKASGNKLSFKNKLIEKISYRGKTCEVKGETQLYFPTTSEEAFYVTPLCMPIFQEGHNKMLYLPEERTAYLPYREELLSFESISKKQRENLEGNIKTFLKGKLFRGVVGFDLNSSDYKITGFKHYIYRGTEVSLTIVNAESVEPKSIGYNFEVFFLSEKDEPWYIADSAFDDPCGNEYDFKNNYFESRNRLFNKFKNMKPELFTTAWFYDKSTPSFLEFTTGRRKNSYYVDFKKRLEILKQDDYRQLVSNDPGIGLQEMTKNEEKKR